MWEKFKGELVAGVCLVVICVGTYYIAWGFLTPPLYH